MSVGFWCFGSMIATSLRQASSLLVVHPRSLCLKDIYKPSSQDQNHLDILQEAQSCYNTTEPQKQNPCWLEWVSTYKGYPQCHIPNHIALDQELVLEKVSPLMTLLGPKTAPLEMTLHPVTETTTPWTLRPPYQPHPPVASPKMLTWNSYCCFFLLDIRDSVFPAFAVYLACGMLLVL